MTKPLGRGKNGSVFSYPKEKFDQELTAITQSEINFLAKELQKAMTIKLNRVRENRKITV